MSLNKILSGQPVSAAASSYSLMVALQLHIHALFVPTILLSYFCYFVHLFLCTLLVSVSASLNFRFYSLCDFLACIFMHQCLGMMQTKFG